MTQHLHILVFTWAAACVREEACTRLLSAGLFLGMKN